MGSNRPGMPRRGPAGAGQRPIRKHPAGATLNIASGAGGMTIDPVAYARAADDARSDMVLSDFGHLRSELKAEYWRRWKDSPDEANQWLTDAHEIRIRTPKVVAEIYTHDDLEQTARWIGNQCERWRTDAELDAFRLRHLLPDVPGTKGGPRLRRAADWRRFWRPVLRRLVARYRDQIMRHLGLVSARKQIYCANLTVRLQQQRKAATFDVLERLVAVSDEGDRINLLDLYQRSLANLSNRRAEMLARIRGFDLEAERLGHAAMFVSLTAPSRYHACWQKSGDPNPKYNGATPKETNDYLRTVWSRVRAKLSREGIEIYGVRVAEPHHDGTPHWHLLLFYRLAHGRQIQRIFRHYALQEEGSEPGASKRRVTFERIDRAKGSATGYVIKYVSKGLDGEGVGEDLYGSEAKSAADRIVAWARTWGIHQFQFIGGPSVGIWREYRRIKPHASESVPLAHYAAWHAASVEVRWDKFCQHMGGTTPGRRQPTTLERSPLVDPDTGEMRRYRSRYGDLLPQSARPVIGLMRDGALLRTRSKEWRIEIDRERRPPRRVEPGRPVSIASIPQTGRARIRGFFNKSAADNLVRTEDGRWILPDADSVGPWTRVTNCTGRHSKQPPRGFETRWASTLEIQETHDTLAGQIK